MCLGISRTTRTCEMCNGATVAELRTRKMLEVCALVSYCTLAANKGN